MTRIIKKNYAKLIRKPSRSLKNRGTRMEKHGYLGNKIGADKINEKGNSQAR